MSTKYISPSLRRGVIAHLKVLYPSTLEDFRSKARRDLLPVDFNGITGVNIGLGYDVPAILPAAYYLCSIMTHAQLTSAIQNNGSPANFAQPTYLFFAEFKERFAFTISGAAIRTKPAPLNCTLPPCHIEYPVHLSRQDILMQNPLVILGECFFSYEDHYHPPDRICDDCKQTLDRRRVDIQKAVWSAFPSCCKLGDWHDLQAVD